MSNTKAFGGSAVNEARISYFRNALHKDNPEGSFATLSSLGFMTGLGSLGIIPDGTPGYPQYVPQIIFNNFNIGVPPLNTYQPNTTYMASDVFSKSMGKHLLKFGGEFRYLQVNERNYANVNGGFVFNGTVTGDWQLPWHGFCGLPPWRACKPQWFHAGRLAVARFPHPLWRRVFPGHL